MWVNFPRAHFEYIFELAHFELPVVPSNLELIIKLWISQNCSACTCIWPLWLAVNSRIADSLTSNGGCVSAADGRAVLDPALGHFTMKELASSLETCSSYVALRKVLYSLISCTVCIL